MFSVIVFFTTIYCFDLVFNAIPNICIFFSEHLFSLTELLKVKYLFPFFSSIYPLAWFTIKYKGFTLQISSQSIKKLSKVVNINPFAVRLVYFSQVWFEVFGIGHVVVKIVSFWSVFFWFAPLISSMELHSVICCLRMSTKLNTSKIFFWVPIKKH